MVKMTGSINIRLPKGWEHSVQSTGSGNYIHGIAKRVTPRRAIMITTEVTSMYGIGQGAVKIKAKNMYFKRMYSGKLFEMPVENVSHVNILEEKNTPYTDVSQKTIRKWIKKYGG